MATVNTKNIRLAVCQNVRFWTGMGTGMVTVGSLMEFTTRSNVNGNWVFRIWVVYTDSIGLSCEGGEGIRVGSVFKEDIAVVYRLEAAKQDWVKSEAAMASNYIYQRVYRSSHRFANLKVYV
ncbi:hypothetical protein AA313_de0204551 [Arthrobotrys entomopaga]|nr:hypothetical protein AA313_de0204551 [Arthrobotrys entomopaga]